MIDPCLFGSFDHDKPECSYTVAEVVSGQISFWFYFWECFVAHHPFLKQTKITDFYYCVFLFVSPLYLLLIFMPLLPHPPIKTYIHCTGRRNKTWSLLLRKLEFGERPNQQEECYLQSIKA